MFLVTLYGLMFERQMSTTALIVQSCKVVVIPTREHGLLLKHLSLQVLKRTTKCLCRLEVFLTV